MKRIAWPLVLLALSLLVSACATNLGNLFDVF
jgi:predicted small secreted protein